MDRITRGNNTKKNFLSEIVETRTISNPRQIDEFEITVIDLTGKDVWRGNTGNTANPSSI